MQLKSLELHGYRNYDKLELATGAGVNILIGPNAQGKTNLLEAIHVLALTKSHRTSKDKELIGWNQPSARHLPPCVGDVDFIGSGSASSPKSHARRRQASDARSTSSRSIASSARCTLRSPLPK
ncbi:MAG: AAA family ATPase [Candidatus Bipolaricaulota bacterium]|nr:AAA family ATPase [Candidatus Bipolaricaulota bacterium]